MMNDWTIPSAIPLALFLLISFIYVIKYEILKKGKDGSDVGAEMFLAHIIFLLFLVSLGLVISEWRYLNG